MSPRTERRLYRNMLPLIVIGSILFIIAVLGILALTGCATRHGNIRVVTKPITTTIGPGVQVWFYKSDTGELIDTTFVAEKEND